LLKLAGVAAGASLVSSVTLTPSGGQATWDAGQVAHLLPTANHERFLIKTSFKAALDDAPVLRVADRRVQGMMTDTQRRFWMFDVGGLSPATRYDLQLVTAAGRPLCDRWPLTTLPAPGSRPDRLRILAYTCGGGYDGPPFAGKTFFLDMAARRKLLDRGLSFEPDVVIANGDQIYWDQQTTLNKGALGDHVKTNFWPRFGALDANIPFLGTSNEATLKAVADYQIASLYDVRLRSVPSFFLTDDHDEFENDEYDDKLATMPAGDFGLDGQDATQFLYYPEFLPDPTRPAFLPGTNRLGRAPGINQFFGTLRYGDLLEVVLYDCRRFADYKGVQARLVPKWTEDWLIRRTLAEDTAQFFHAPSLPFAYTSGKLGDWYPDVLGDQGRVVLYKPKPGWQPGWLAQHQRLIEALTKQQRRSAVVVQGDFHASGVGKMTRVADLNLARNPVHAVLSGTLGTGDYAFPSSVRAVQTSPSELVTIDEAMPATEKNGFTVIDVMPSKMTFRIFMWRPPEPVAAIDNLQPALTYEVSRAA
jgi:phosphodiesterase/alkaline phosphatase D-like protein